MKKPILVLLMCVLYIATHAQYRFKRFDINPAGSSFPTPFNPIGNKIYFQANDNVHGVELWVTDGTDTGTKMVIDIVPGNGSSQPEFFMALGSQIIFTADSTGLGRELWITDGTATGTKLLKDINPGSTGSSMNEFTHYNGKIYFKAYTPTTGHELWVTDGTPAGTALLKEIWPGTSSGSPTNITAYNGKLYFYGIQFSGINLWESDGTTSGTKIATPFTTTGAGITGGLFPLPILNNKLFFGNFSGTNTSLYMTDGPLTNKQLVKTINPTQPNNISFKIIANNQLYFVADDSVHGEELWVTDGTTNGTYMLKDISPPMPSFLNSTKDCYLYNGKVYFNNNDSVHGEEIWVTDGTDTGTHFFMDINPGTAGSYPRRFITCKGKMYFSATTANNRKMLFVTDGTVSGTTTVQPIGAQTHSSHKSSVAYMTVLDSTIYTEAYYDTTRTELWAITDTSINTPPPNKLTNTIQTLPDITLYPNPAHHNFTIKTTTAFKTGSVTLTDVTGRVVKTDKLYNNEQTIPLQGIAPGMYMVDVWLDDKRTTEKLVVE